MNWQKFWREEGWYFTALGLIVAICLSIAIWAVFV